jgi:hypothetical protein
MFDFPFGSQEKNSSEPIISALRFASTAAELGAELVPDSFDIRLVPGIHVSLRFPNYTRVA